MKKTTPPVGFCMPVNVLVGFFKNGLGNSVLLFLLCYCYTRDGTLASKIGLAVVATCQFPKDPKSS